MATEPRNFPGLGLVGAWPLGSSDYKPALDNDLRLLSILTALSVKSATTALPGSPTNGDIYIVPSGGDAGKIAARDDGAWVMITPTEGQIALVADTQTIMIRKGGAWAELSVGGGGDSGSTGAHRYWRVRWDANINGSGYVTLNKLIMKASAGGANLATGGTPLASGSYNSSTQPANAFDNDDATSWESAEKAPSTGLNFLGYDFGAAVNIDYLEFVTNSYEPNERPTAGTLQWSDDGTTWTTKWSFSGLVWGTPPQTLATQAQPPSLTSKSPMASRWRVLFKQNGGDQRVGLGEIQFLETPGSEQLQAPSGLGATVSVSSSYAGGAAAASNGNVADRWLADGVSNQWVEWNFGASPKSINEVRIWSTDEEAYCRVCAPRTFDVQYFDGVMWITAWTVYNTYYPDSTPSFPKRFTRPGYVGTREVGIPAHDMTMPGTMTASTMLVTAGAVGAYLRTTNTGSTVLARVRPNGDYPIPVGAVIDFRQASGGKLTFEAGPGVTINTPETLKARKQGSTVRLRKIAADAWDLSGDLEVAV